MIVRSPHLPGVELKTVREAQRLWRVFHEKHALVCPIAGISGRIFRARTIARRPGELMLYAPGDCDTNTYFEPGSAFHVVSFDAHVLDEAAKAMGARLRWQPAASTLTSRGLSARARALAMAMHRAECQLEVESALTELVGELVREHLTPTSARSRAHAAGSDRGIARVRERLHTDLHGGLSLDELAREMRMDKYQLLRRFKAYYGTTPYAYRQALRVARARTMLRGGRRSGDVGAFLGFADLSHFRRTFVKYVGLSPSEYRRARG